MGEKLTNLLQPIADWFNTLGLPEPITHWGHPLMMGIVLFMMGSFVGFTGWRSRITDDDELKKANRLGHRQFAPLMFLFITLGYTGGVLSLVMQGHSLFESSHFWIGSSIILLLGLNGLISFTGFGGNKESLRTVHAYLGSIVLVLFLVHAIFGLKLGFSL